ncbi:MAG: oxaloacetate decarboxylase [Alphaproteobacteria bacterium]
MASLRAMLDGERPVLATVVFNPLMARLAEAAGFPALYLGGGTLGYVKTVLEANLNLTELVQLGIDIRTACNLPLILDGACGWGDPMHMRRTMAMTEAAGFAAIEIEDQVLPKRAHHHIGIERMIPQELMEAKIRECVAARQSADTLIVGRTNAIRSSNMDDALRRAEGYRKAGADLLMLFPRNPEEIRHVHERLGGPFMFLTPRGGVRMLGMTVEELGAHGCRILADSGTPLLAGYAAWKRCYEETLRNGMNDPGLDAATAHDLEEDMFRVIGLQALIDIEKATVEKGA